MHKKVLRVKGMLYYQRGPSSVLELYASHEWGVIFQNTHGSLLSRRRFVRTFAHNLQTIGHLLAFYIPNDLDTIGDNAFQL